MELELQVLYKLDHPYVIQYIESFQDEKYIYIVMEFCEGKELLTILEEKNIMSEKDSAGIIYKLLEGINHIHSVHVAHRDLKPENIMIDKNGNPKIIDFGLSKDTQGDTKVLKSIVGSKLYMPPEIIQGDPHSFSCDMWSLGIILYVMISGKYPFDFRNIENEIVNSPVIFVGPAW